jgi:RNA polymerase sigma-70 factor, ECF subfamily
VGLSSTAPVARAEIRLQLQAALNGMDETDRGLITLRHCEELSNVEAEQVLGMEPSTASKSYIRALKRLQELLRSVSGLL